MPANRFFKRAILLLSTFTLMACSTTMSQYSSGEDYVARYHAQQYSAKSHTVSATSDSLDAQILKIASVEPLLEFPARIGLARIKRNSLISLPMDEAETWQELVESTEREFGEFVPVSPLISAMASSQLSHETAHNVIAKIRAGSARQHLDYVLIYDVIDRTDRQTNALSPADLSILGLFVLPSRNITVNTTATAMLIDVRNGYTYGATSVFEGDTGLATLVGSTAKTERLKDKNRLAVIDKLTHEVGAFMHELKDKRAALYVKNTAP